MPAIHFVQALPGEVVEFLHVGLQKFLEANGVSWHYISAYQPWQGGVYARMVGWSRIFYTKLYLEMSLTTSPSRPRFMSGGERVVNNRPLTYIPGNEISEPPDSEFFPLTGSSYGARGAKRLTGRIQLYGLHLIAWA